MDYVKEAFPKRDNVAEYVMCNLGMNASRAIYQRKLESGKFINILRTTANKTKELLQDIESLTGVKALDRYILYDTLPPDARTYNETDARQDILKQSAEPATQEIPSASVATEIAAELRTMNEIQRAMLMEMRDLSGYLEAICKELNITKSPAPLKE